MEQSENVSSVLFEPQIIDPILVSRLKSVFNKTSFDNSIRFCLIRLSVLMQIWAWFYTVQKIFNKKLCGWDKHQVYRLYLNFWQNVVLASAILEIWYQRCV